MPESTSLRRNRVVHGDDLLYEFFQHVLADDEEAFKAIPQLLLTTMGLWLPFSVYNSWPILLPYVVRDPDCRGKVSAGRTDQWSSPNSMGYLRDDNSLVKGLPRALLVDGPKKRKVAGARMGTEFVAAHVWRKTLGSDVLANRVPTLNSFVPNLVWLPGQIAKLTDREGSIVQRTAQAMSYEIYRDAPVAPHLLKLVEESWSELEKPPLEIEPVDLADLNWFRATPRFLALREHRVRTVVDALHRVRKGLPLEHKVVATRYTDGLPGVSKDAVEALLLALEHFLPAKANNERAGLDL